VSKREQSVLLISRLLDRLAENGVVADNLSTYDLFNPPPSDADVQLYLGTIKWLEAEGVIRTDGGCQGGRDNELVYEIVLTSRGFSLLERRLTNNLTLGGAIQKLARSESGLAGLGDLIGGVLGGFTKSVSS